MMEGIEVSGIVSWPQAFVAVVIVLALSIVPQVLGYLKTRSTATKVVEVQHELENNSGSTLRDAVDRIEEKLTEHIADAQEWRTQVEDVITRNNGGNP
jgi:cytochrome c-type biogenesis protein CcmH/NrfG